MVLYHISPDYGRPKFHFSSGAPGPGPESGIPPSGGRPWSGSGPGKTAPSGERAGLAIGQGPAAAAALPAAHGPRRQGAAGSPRVRRGARQAPGSRRAPPRPTGPRPGRPVRRWKTARSRPPSRSPRSRRPSSPGPRPATAPAPGPAPQLEHRVLPGGGHGHGSGRPAPDIHRIRHAARLLPGSVCPGSRKCPALRAELFR